MSNEETNEEVKYSRSHSSVIEYIHADGDEFWYFLTLRHNNLQLMSKRGLLIFLLTFAFLLSAWGNVIAVAFCPRYLSNCAFSIRPSSQETRQVDRNASCHHEMAEMEMSDGQMDETEMQSEADVKTLNNSVADAPPIQVETETSTQRIVIDRPAETCGHCWMHSQPASGAATLVAVDPATRLIDTDAPPAECAVTLAHDLTVSIAPQEHGPPGNFLPRHVLINVFRI